MKKSFVKIGLIAMAGLSLTMTGCKEDNKEVGESTSECTSGEITTEISNCNSEEVTVVEINACSKGVGTTTWTKDNVYSINGFVFVNSGQILTIEAGTIIKGSAGNGANASALIVASGGKIMAEGTKEEPIIFTRQYA